MTLSIENGCSASTTFVWKKVKIELAARPQGTARAKRARSGSNAGNARGKGTLPRHTTGVLLKYRGGAQAWWELSYAGRTVRIEGFVALHDAMNHLFGICPEEHPFEVEIV